ncbi:MAG TPA: hypothetical protein VG265_07320 [Gaiellaceae bacterium]|nr:hypothetical protein [Gaiellaceae bacterium]
MTKLPVWSTTAPGVTAVHELGYEQIRWGYGDPPKIAPRSHFGPGYATKVEPMPAYGHDVDQVCALLERCHQEAPLCVPVSVNVLKLVDGRGSNGWAQQRWCYDDDSRFADDEAPAQRKYRNWDGVIVLSGKTTEIHPAIARYVVPHEYAHVLEDALGLIRYGDLSEHRSSEALMREWAEVRGVDDRFFDLEYSVTNHHLQPCEVFANDFRRLIGAEREWWPHDDVVPALGVLDTSPAGLWWDEAIDQLRECSKQAKAAA